MSILRRLTCLSLAAALSLAATAGATPSELAMDEALRRLRDADARVATAAHRLKAANAPLCAVATPQIGLVLHDLAQYGPDFRPRAAAVFGLSTGRIGVLALARGGPADRAGVREGDILLAMDGAALTAVQAHAVEATYANVAHAQKALRDALADGAVALRLSRGGRELTIEVNGEPACDYQVQLAAGRGLSAGADGRLVSIGPELAGRLSDDDLALVLGHELAHNILDHSRRTRSGLVGLLKLNVGALRAAEREADHVGLYLTARAGYDVRGAADFWRRATSLGAASLTHPGPAERAKAVTRTAEEIERKRARGEPLVPKLR